MVVHRSRNLKESPTLISDQSLTLKGFSRLLRPRRSGTLIFMFAHKKGISAQGCAGLNNGEQKANILECSEVGTQHACRTIVSRSFSLFFVSPHPLFFLILSPFTLCLYIVLSPSLSLSLLQTHTHIIILIFSFHIIYVSPIFSSYLL